MRFLLIIFIFYFLSGCQSDKKSSAYSIALQQVKEMIDRQCFKSKYVILYETKSDEFGSIYEIKPSAIPFQEWSMEVPTTLIKYKGKFVCFISPTSAKEISVKELNKETDYKNDYEPDVYWESWFLGISADGEKYTLVSPEDADSRTQMFLPYVCPKMWKYLSDTYNEENPPRFILGFYQLLADGMGETENTLKNHLYGIRGELYYPNSNDIRFFETKQTGNKPFFGVLNKTDTLLLFIEDTLYQHLQFESLPNRHFFDGLPSNDTWYALYNLLRDSTFYFQYEKGRYEKYPVMFCNAYWVFGVLDSVGTHLSSFYKEGVNKDLKDLFSFERWENAE